MFYFIYVFKLFVDVFKVFIVGDVIYQYDVYCFFVVGGCDGVKSFLVCCVFEIIINNFIEYFSIIKF